MLETKKDVMPLVVSDENLQTQESMVIVFDSGGKWALMNLTGLVDWLLRNFLSQFAKASDMLASWPDMLTLLITVFLKWSQAGLIEPVDLSTVCFID